MKLYFSPLACSLSSRIALYEVGAHVTFVEVDGKTKRTSDGRDFHDLAPLGLVPVLELDDGTLLTENAAILQYVAEAFPDADLAPNDVLGRARLRQWLSFIGTELHKGLFMPLLAKDTTDGAKSFALGKRDSRLDLLERHLDGREFLLDRFSVADAYLYTVLNWSMVTPVELAKWPRLHAYHARVAARPHVKRAFNEERLLYGKELLLRAPRAVMDFVRG
jgi:glutathione S-transferase